MYSVFNNNERIMIMKVKELENKGLKRKLEVKISASELSKKIEDRLVEVGKTVKLPGFRPGKVPMQVLKTRFEDGVLGEVVEKTVNESSNKAINDNKLRPALQPKIEITSFDKGKDLAYTIELEVVPDFEIQDLSKITLEKLVVEPDTKTVDEALERIASQHKTSEAITGKRAAKKGDIVVIDFDGECEGNRLPGMKSDDFHLELGSGMFVGNFEDQLVGKKAGDETKVEVTFPENYGNKDLAGKPATFDVKVKEIRETKAVEMDDELAKKVGMETIDQLKDAIKEQAQSEYDNLSRMKLKRALLDAMDEQYGFDLPEGMVELEYESIKRQAELEKKNEEGDKAELSKDDLSELKEIAERRVRLGLVLSELGQKHNVTVSNEDLQRAVIAEAQKYPGQEAQVFEMFQKNEQMLNNLRAPVFEEKVVDFILEEVTIKEKKSTLDELTADDDAELPKKKKPASKAKAKPAAKKDDDKKPAAKKAPAKKPATKKKTDEK
jgi:trigger factor